MRALGWTLLVLVVVVVGGFGGDFIAAALLIAGGTWAISRSRMRGAVARRLPACEPTSPMTVMTPRGRLSARTPWVSHLLDPSTRVSPLMAESLRMMSRPSIATEAKPSGKTATAAAAGTGQLRKRVRAITTTSALAVSAVAASAVAAGEMTTWTTVDSSAGHAAAVAALLRHAGQASHRSAVAEEGRAHGSI